MTRIFKGLVLLAVLIGFSAAINGRLSDLLPIDVPTQLSAQAVSAAPAVIAAADQDISSAIQQVIQRSNDEQVQ
ncbi:MAG TPA: hypothetical protein VGQ62_15860, partial [Chloroflexota bacterium]|nr:hypothetical protein [Chloroflexota bacterium]